MCHIRKVKGGYKVTKGGGKFRTRKAAASQLRAIYASKNKRRRKKG
jgi:hypothetical protein